MIRSIQTVITSFGYNMIMACDLMGCGHSLWKMECDHEGRKLNDWERIDLPTGSGIDVIIKSLEETANSSEHINNLRSGEFIHIDALQGHASANQMQRRDNLENAQYLNGVFVPEIKEAFAVPENLMQCSTPQQIVDFTTASKDIGPDAPHESWWPQNETIPFGRCFAIDRSNGTNVALDIYYDQKKARYAVQNLDTPDSDISILSREELNNTYYFISDPDIKQVVVKSGACLIQSKATKIKYCATIEFLGPDGLNLSIGPVASVIQNYALDVEGFNKLWSVVEYYS